MGFNPFNLTGKGVGRTPVRSGEKLVREAIFAGEKETKRWKRPRAVQAFKFHSVTYKESMNSGIMRKPVKGYL
jgi:hypothetical protein